MLKTKLRIDSEESEEEAEEEEVEVKDMEVDDLKDLIRDIISQEMGAEGEKKFLEKSYQ